MLYLLKDKSKEVDKKSMHISLIVIGLELWSR